MRIASRSYINNLSYGLARASQTLQRLSSQLTSAKRITKPSDDPVGAGEILRRNADLAAVTSHQRTIHAGLRTAQSGDVALDDIGVGLRKISTLIIEANSSSTPEPALQAIANEIRSVAGRIRDNANMSVAGRYLFAGFLDRTMPFVEGAPDTITYQGDSSEQKVPVAPGRTAPVTIAGDYLLNFEDAGGKRAIAGLDKDAFTVLEETAQAIEDKQLTELEQLSEEVELLRDHAVQCRAKLGVYVQRLQAAENVAKEQELGTRRILAEIEDVDIAQAVLELKNHELLYQAALLAVGQVMRMPTLFEIAY